MICRVPVLSLMLLAFAAGAPGLSAQAAADRWAVERAVLDYVEGFYEGDTAKLGRSVHPQVSKFGYYIPRDSSRYVGEPMPFDEFIAYALRVRSRGRPAPADAPKRIEVFEILDQTASAKLTAWWGTDYLLLAKEDGRWRIRQVLWQSPPRAAGGPDSGTRAALQTQYERLGAAIRRNDVPGILAVQAPGFVSANLSGQRFDYDAMADYTRRLAAVVDSVIHIRNVIRAFHQRGDTAAVDVCQEFSRIQRFGDGRPRRVDTSVLQRETWVLTSDGWKRARVEDLHGARWFVDGVRVDPSKSWQPGTEAYLPDVDPPTGCGLR